MSAPRPNSATSIGLACRSAPTPTFETIKAYGAWGEKSMYGRTFLGIVRTTVLVGADGRVARIWRKVKVDGHAAEVLEAAKASDHSRNPFSEN